MKNNKYTPWLLALLGAVLFIPFNGNVHLFDWDEINFAEIAREMLRTGNYLEPSMNYFLFTEKPPLFMWLQAMSMHVFGVGDFAARFPNALIGVVVLPLVYQLGKKLYSARFGMLWALAWTGSILPHLYFKSGIIDPLFNLFIFLGIYGIINATWVREQIGFSNRSVGYWIVYAGLFTGLAVMTKGPVAFLITALVVGVVFVWRGFKLPLTIPQLLGYTAVVLGVTGIWFGVNYLQNGPQFIIEFTIRQWELFSTPDAGHGGFPGYHFVVLLIGCFPISIFTIHAFFHKEKTGADRQSMKFWMHVLFWVVLILFTIVKSKIVHYSSLAYYPMTYLAALSIEKLWDQRWKWKGYFSWTFLILAIVIGIVPLVLPYFGMHPEELKPMLAADPFAVENMEAEVPWTGWEPIMGIFMLFVAAYGFSQMRRRNWKTMPILFAFIAIFVQGTLFLFLGKIERISQRAHVAFWEGTQTQDAYKTTYDFKSYVPPFYGNVLPGGNENRLDIEWLLSGESDKNVLVSTKVNSVKKFEENFPNTHFLGHKNGFYFYMWVPEGSEDQVDLLKAQLINANLVRD